MDDIFRSFFGFPNPHTGRPDDKCEHYTAPVPHGSDSGNLDQHGADIFVFTHPSDIFRQFDEMIANFDRVFQHFGAIDQLPEGLDPVVPPQYGLNPRDKMLKNPDLVEPSQPAEEWQMPGSQPSWFGRLWSRPFRHHEPVIKEDSDLDESVRSRGIGSILDECEVAPRVPQRSSVFQSVSVRTHRTADGKIEETRTIVDGEGNHQTIVTRTVDGQTVRQTTKKNRSGETEVVEDLINMDETDKQTFDQKWNAQSPSDGRQVSPRNEVLREFNSDMSDGALFSRLFGSDFKWFWNK